MVILRNKEIRNLNKKDLDEKIKELKLEILKINSQKATQSATGTKRIREIKKVIARIKTHLNKKNLEK